jgi:hypothetical protein
MKKLLVRLPDSQSVLYVYATAVFLVYGWTLVTSFWKVPSWLFYLTLGEVLSIYSYSFVVNFLESVLLMLPLLVIAFILPERFWRRHFTSYGIVWVLCVAGSMMVSLYTMRTPNVWNQFVHSQTAWWSGTALLMIALGFVVSHISCLETAIAQLADRLVVFLYVYLPLTAISFVVLAVRIL